MNTAKFVANELRKMGLTVYEGIGKTGIVADLKAGEGKTVIGFKGRHGCDSVGRTRKRF